MKLSMEQWRKNLYTMVTTQICCMIGFGLVSPFIAFYFQEELDSCLKNRGFQMERVIRDPMDGLLEYYLIK